ncbi:polygalacturonase-like [Amaranthus tricolor]|uniref:polygalacturonase-like n=1 Tax=Amaranthus tricolor TaxID=29722 RepID=UPI00258B3B7C|nr:polygalacturonase-like [Amaranthus tricolor]
MAIIWVLIIQRSILANNINYNLVRFGAKPDGSDTSKAFTSAWNTACQSENPSTIVVPKGRYFVNSALLFSGKNCKVKSIKFVIRGTLVAPSDFRLLGDAGTWFAFEDVTGVSISGGVFDGQGSGLWACKRSSERCPAGATTLRFSNSNNIEINGVTSVNSQLYHIVFDGCKNVKVEGVKISTSGRSPNTDGIHVQLSNGVTILNSNIATGDDCVSVGAGTTNLWIENMACGPGHGVSIGSLGKDVNEAGVVNVTVKTATFTGTENGVRIKSWGRPSNGFVRNVLFQHITMLNAQNPIIIDQNYCPDDKGCSGKASGVRISDVTYQDIHGSSATPIAVKFDCSSEYHCTNIKLEGVDLTYRNQQAASSCVNTIGSTYGVIEPKSCF